MRDGAEHQLADPWFKRVTTEISHRPSTGDELGKALAPPFNSLRLPTKTQVAEPSEGSCHQGIVVVNASDAYEAL